MHMTTWQHCAPVLADEPVVLTEVQCSNGVEVLFQQCVHFKHAEMADQDQTFRS